MCLGVPGKIIDLKENYMAVVDVNGNQTEISIRLTPEAELGQYVLIHAGFAMEVVDETIALETMQYLEEMLQYE
ncbi:Hydrogenase expression/formation protein, HupF/HypC [Syntrophomonas zehnderi OL-4]|uniref:Hydrogenase expression/formation protein, HupF/HypC n=1 Tax=Syntrophomonas zehnderi OL-4 TaxID=690567 RepID=A0A0E4C873_9FIRM|nr:HypC/HybG/HupF family hydrogenase formation chaperone [Syntrophomonas zehnderi]CFX28313.1 Hydrogenase expression/formation protein, HupF/HypC [Syntrophomonas zehnderi OL-4]